MTRHQAYEQLKSEWLRKHPQATAEQIEQAFRAIAKRVGV